MILIVALPPTVEYIFWMGCRKAQCMNEAQEQLLAAELAKHLVCIGGSIGETRNLAPSSGLETEHVQAILGLQTGDKL